MVSRATAAGALLALLIAAARGHEATQFPPPPGAYDPRATAADVCRDGYTHSERARDTYAVRDRVYRRYGLERGHRFGFRIDHLIPLELGGITDDRNLWPQPVLEAARKDEDEDALHDAVCDGRLTLDAARAEILRLWGPQR